jgi:putative ABC transport system substrate-binding protein
MKRREFTLIGSKAVAWPLAARAQQPAMPLIGFLGGGSSESNAFRAVDCRRAEDHYERLAAELVRREVAVIVTMGGSVSAIAAESAIATIPIVFAIGTKRNMARSPT